MKIINKFTCILFNSSSYEQQEEVAYETLQNDNEMDHIEVVEPVVQRIQSVGTRFKQENYDDSSDPLYTGNYLDQPKRKSPTKRQSTAQNGKEFI